jgi:hypothetical protein
MADVFSTSNTALSVMAAHEQFTHIVLNRSYHIINPVYFKTGLIAHLPVFLFANWDRGTFSQLAKWRDKGGVLIDRSATSHDVGDNDVLIHAECPLSMRSLDWSRINTQQQVIINKPISWKMHFDALDLIAPGAETCRRIRAALHEVPERAGVAAASRYPESLLVTTDSEIAATAAILPQHVMYMRRMLKPQEVWSVKLRIKPEDAGLVQSWDEIEALDVVNGARNFTKIGAIGQPWKRSIKEMARQGNIGLTRFHVYPTGEINFNKIQREHDLAYINLQEIQRFVEGLPVHPQA